MVFVHYAHKYSVGTAPISKRDTSIIAVVEENSSLSEACWRLFYLNFRCCCTKIGTTAFIEPL